MDNSSSLIVPCIIDETKNFAVVFKPPRMHCTSAKAAFGSAKAAFGSAKAAFGSAKAAFGSAGPLKINSEISELNENFNNKSCDSLFDWYKKNSKTVYDVMHRLDYETHGLVLFAKNQKAFNFIKSAQDNGFFIKEYSAKCIIQPEISPDVNKPSIDNPFVIKSYFRPYGIGRKVVRPVTDDNKKYKEIAKDKGGFYKTEIISINNNIFTVRIKRGFRHQIRSHLLWIGFPILNDPLYFSDISEEKETGTNKKEEKILFSEAADFLALKSHAIFFPDPEKGEQCEYRIPPLS